jgi:hypothetical protein
MKTITTLIYSAFAVFTFAWLALCPMAHAVQPPPDGGYPGFNTAEGQNALFSLHTGGANTGVGWYALFSVTDGSSNTAVGAGTLVLNTGNSNTATGTGALLLNSTGEANTGTGALVLANNKTGSENSALGSNALTNNISGSFNTAIGASALQSNIGGDDNVAVGVDAGADVMGSGNVYIGRGVRGVAGESNHTYIRNINTTNLANDPDILLVVVDSNTRLLGTISLPPRDLLKDHNRVEEQQASIAELKAIIAQQQEGMEALTAQLKEQAAQIQRLERAH